MRRKKNTARRLVWGLLFISISVMAGACYTKYLLDQEYAEGDAVYEKISAEVRTQSAISTTAYAPQTEQSVYVPPEPQVEIPAIDVDFQQLKEINEDAAAWLYCPDTMIDYPVMRADDYSYYLTHLPDGAYNKNGALFLDYHCKPDFSDALSIIYGHHMKSGKMFGKLVGYKDQTYYEEHPYMYIYTADGNYRIDLLYGFVIGADVWKENGFMHPENTGALIDYCRGKSTFESNVVYDGTKDRLVALSTCSYEFNDARFCVLGVLVPEYAPTS